MLSYDEAFKLLLEREEACLRRMLCQWDPAWGTPQLVQRETPPLKVDENGIGKLYSTLVGLSLETASGEDPILKILARDQLDANGEILPLVPDLGQLAVYLALLVEGNQSVH